MQASIEVGFGQRVGSLMNTRVSRRANLATFWPVAALVTAASCASDSRSDSDASVPASDAAVPASDAAVPARDASVQPTDAAADAPLPAAFKGYELYAWDERGDVSYTLITGTNRQKTLTEITTQEPAVEDAGDWVLIRGHGLAALKRLLARVPAGTEVILSAFDGLPALSDAHRQAVVELLSR